jgi:hypothetical protein
MTYSIHTKANPLEAQCKEMNGTSIPLPLYLLPLPLLFNVANSSFLQHHPRL